MFASTFTLKLVILLANAMHAVKPSNEFLLALYRLIKTWNMPVNAWEIILSWLVQKKNSKTYHDCWHFQLPYYCSMLIFIAVNTPIQSLFLFLFCFMLGLIHLNIADSDEMSQNWHFVWVCTVYLIEFTHERNSFVILIHKEGTESRDFSCTGKHNSGRT